MYYTAMNAGYTGSPSHAAKDHTIFSN